MPSATRTILALALLAQLTSSAFAQEAEATRAAAETASETTAEKPQAASSAPAPAQPVAVGQGSSEYQIRSEFSTLLRNHPRELSMVLVVDPSLVANQVYLAKYPDVAAYVNDHPEILRNPGFYLAEFEKPGRTRSPLENMLEAIAITGSFAVIAFALLWLVRTVIEQKRWSRLARTQTEVHNKILDRFGSSEEVLAYIKSPAGTKFLESAPIPVRAEYPMRNTPVTRILWSVQLGVVLALGALGMLIVSFRFEKEASHDLFALGVIAFCIGAGFIASAAVSLMLSKRLGLWSGQAAPPAALDDSGFVR